MFLVHTLCGFRDGSVVSRTVHRGANDTERLHLLRLTSQAVEQLILPPFNSRAKSSKFYGDLSSFEPRTVVSTVTVTQLSCRLD